MKSQQFNHRCHFIFFRCSHQLLLVVITHSTMLGHAKFASPYIARKTTYTSTRANIVLRSSLTIENLKLAIRELGERFLRVGDDDLFVLWFLRAYVTESEDRAAEAIVGGTRDKSVDAIFVDDAARAVFLVQGKYRKTLVGKVESRSDVVAFADLAARLHGPDDDEFRSFLSDTDSAVADRLRAVRQKVLNHKYSTWLYFVTTAKVSGSVLRTCRIRCGGLVSIRGLRSLTEHGRCCFF
jgi:hypothetical protein